MELHSLKYLAEGGEKAKEGKDHFTRWAFWRITLQVIYTICSLSNEQVLTILYEGGWKLKVIMYQCDY